MKVNIKRSRKFWLTTAAITLLIVASSGAGIWLYKDNHKYQVTVTAEERMLADTKADEIPANDAGKVTYYANLGDAYYTAGDYKNALDSTLKADSYIKNRDPNVVGSRSVNLLIARSYEKLGNKEKAREYYQREIDRLRLKKQNPDTDQTIEYYVKLRDRL